MSRFRNQTPITPEQVAVLETVKQKILANVDQFDMCSYVQRDHENLCGTPSCVAGYIAFVVHPETFGRYVDLSDAVRAIAYRFFRTEYSEYIDEWIPLFHEGRWDADLRDRYEEADDECDQLEMALVACEAIDRFVANTNAHFAEVEA